MEHLADAIKIATQSLTNYTSEQIATLTDAAYSAVKAAHPNFAGGSFRMIGDFGGTFTRTILVQEASTIGSKRAARTWFYGHNLATARTILKRIA